VKEADAIEVFERDVTDQGCDPRGGRQSRDAPL